MGKKARERELPEVVQQRRLLDLLEHRHRQVHRPGGRRRGLRDAPGVRVEIGRTGAHDRHQGIERRTALSAGEHSLQRVKGFQ